MRHGDIPFIFLSRSLRVSLKSLPRQYFSGSDISPEFSAFFCLGTELAERGFLNESGDSFVYRGFVLVKVATDDGVVLGVSEASERERLLGILCLSVGRLSRVGPLGSTFPALS